MQTQTRPTDHDQEDDFVHKSKALDRALHHKNVEGVYETQVCCAVRERDACCIVCTVLCALLCVLCLVCACVLTTIVLVVLKCRVLLVAVRRFCLARFRWTSPPCSALGASPA